MAGFPAEPWDGVRVAVFFFWGGRFEGQRGVVMRVRVLLVRARALLVPVAFVCVVLVRVLSCVFRCLFLFLSRSLYVSIFLCFFCLPEIKNIKKTGGDRQAEWSDNGATTERQ